MQTKHYITAIISMAFAITSLNCVAMNPEYTLLKGSDNISWNIDAAGTLHIESATTMCPNFTVSPFINYKDVIRDVVFEDNGWDATLENIGKNMFKGLDHIQTVQLPENLKVIGDGAFEDCASLIELNIPDGVEEMGKNSLRGCSSLKALTLPFIGADGTSWVTNEEKNYIGWIFGRTPGNDFYKVSQAIGSGSVLTCSLPVTLTKITVNGGYVYANAFTNCDKIDNIVLGEKVMTMPLSIAVGQYGNTKLFSQL